MEKEGSLQGEKLHRHRGLSRRRSGGKLGLCRADRAWIQYDRHRHGCGATLCHLAGAEHLARAASGTR